MQAEFKTERNGRTGVVKSFASLLEPEAKAQAERISRHPLIGGQNQHVALMPDAHMGSGATVGSIIPTVGGIIPSAVGVDLSCGMVAVETDLPYESLLEPEKRQILGTIRETVPSGVGKGRNETHSHWHAFYHENGNPPTVDKMDKTQATDMMVRASKQFGTLGSGNHFAEYSYDERGVVWLVVHSGSRGIGNKLATNHIRAAKKFCKDNGLEIEHPDLAYLVEGTPEFDAYIGDMLWAHEYAAKQRNAMMYEMLRALEGVKKFHAVQRIQCTHNYSERVDLAKFTLMRWVINGWLSRKGAIDATQGMPGIIPGSMGDLSFIVEGKGNKESYDSAPHGAGRMLPRKKAFNTLDLQSFLDKMEGKTWQDRDASKLLDEAPQAYKPIKTVMADSEELVTLLHTLTQFINYKGL